MGGGEAGLQLALLQGERGGGQFGQNLARYDHIAHVGGERFDRLTFNQGDDRHLFNGGDHAGRQNMVFYDTRCNFCHCDGG